MLLGLRLPHSAALPHLCEGNTALPLLTLCLCAFAPPAPVLLPLQPSPTTQRLSLGLRQCPVLDNVLVGRVDDDIIQILQQKTMIVAGEY